jgi:hypothetical protein
MGWHWVNELVIESQSVATGRTHHERKARTTMPLPFLGAKDALILHHGFGRSYIQATGHPEEELGLFRLHSLQSGLCCWCLRLRLPSVLDFHPQCSFTFLGLT